MTFLCFPILFSNLTNITTHTYRDTRRMQKCILGSTVYMYLGMRSFIMKAVTYVISWLPLNNRLLSNLTYLQPQQSLSTTSVTDIQFIARKLPNISHADIATLTDKWNLYQLNQKTAEMINDLDTNPHIHIDDYWRTVATQKVPTGKLKYPIVAT